MDISLSGEKISWMKPVCGCRFTREETAEIIVPDTQPDILRVVCADGTPLLRGKDADAGRVTVSGVAEATVLYVPEDEKGVQKLEASIPFSASAENEEITPECLLTARVTLCSADARAVNPRKVVVRLELAYEIGCYLPSACTLFSAAESEGVQLLPAEKEAELPSAVGEKTFVVTDELKLPAGAQPIAEMLLCTLQMTAEDCKSVGNKTLVKGTAQVRALYRADGGALCAASFSSPYSQIVETGTPGEAAAFDAGVMPTGFFVSRGVSAADGGAAYTMEVHAVAQCVAYCWSRLAYIADAYSTKFDLALTQDTVEFSAAPERTQGESEASGAIAAKDPSEPAAVSAKAGSVSRTEKDGITTLTAGVGVTVVYTGVDGAPESAFRRIEASCELSAADGAAMEAFAEIGGEAAARVTPDGFDVSVPVRFTAQGSSRVSFTAVSAIGYDEEKPKETAGMPSLTVCRAAEGGSLWDLAKKFGSTTELIVSANALGDTAFPETGSVLIIPRAR